jgi:hypothetical protein
VPVAPVPVQGTAEILFGPGTAGVQTQLNGAAESVATMDVPLRKTTLLVSRLTCATMVYLVPVKRTSPSMKGALLY